MNTDITGTGRIFDLPGFGVVGEPALLFDPTDGHSRHIHPLLGLLTFGPFSRDQVGAVPNPIRIATIAPHGETTILEKLLREIDGHHRPLERRVYLPEFQGFRKIFRVALTHAPGVARIELPDSLEQQIGLTIRPQEVLAQAVLNAIQALRLVRTDFDLVMLYLPERWRCAFESNDGDGFDLHDFLKANSAALGIPMQIVNDRPSGALSYYCRCSVAWRLSIALYCKAGGIPWTLADSTADTAFVGVSYALRGDFTTKPRFAICCSQVFDAEGAGLDFVAYEAEDVKVFGRNPFLTRSQMMKLMSRSLDIYQRRHGGRKPTRIVVHKNTEFRDEEIAGSFDAFASIDDVELVHVQQNVPWRGIFIPKPHEVDGYPVHRGSYMILDEYEALLWTQGNAREIVGGGRNFFKEGKGIPEPLLIRRYAGHGDISTTCREILMLSKMDWNNDGPYDRLPVTMSYASTLANIVKRLLHLDAKPYPFRLFM